MAAASTEQLGLWDDTPEVTWLCPVDRYARQLPPIAILGDDWKAATDWGYLASKRANDLGPDATLAQLYEATTRARHPFYALTGDRTKLDLELAHYADQDR